MSKDIADRLHAEKAALLSEEDKAAEARAIVALDQQSVGRLSRMDAIGRQAMASAQSERRAARIRRIDATLRRMEIGEYGYCVDCGEPVETRRLDADPTTPLCLSCARG